MKAGKFAKKMPVLISLFFIVMILFSTLALAKENNPTYKRFTDREQKGLLGPVKRVVYTQDAGHEGIFNYTRDGILKSWSFYYLNWRRIEFVNNDRGIPVRTTSYFPTGEIEWTFDYQRDDNHTFSAITPKGIKKAVKLDDKGFVVMKTSTYKNGTRKEFQYDQSGLTFKIKELDSSGNIQGVRLLYYNNLGYLASELLYTPATPTKSETVRNMTLTEKKEYIYKKNLPVKVLQTNKDGTISTYREARYEVIDKYGNWLIASQTIKGIPITATRKIEYYE